MWFWLATLIVLASLVFLYSFTEQDSRQVPIERKELIELRKTAIMIQQKRLLDEYQDLMLLQPKKALKLLENTFILDKYGKDLFERDVPEAIYKLRAFNKRTHKIAAVVNNNISYYGPEVVYNRGKHYQLYLSKKSQQHFYSVLAYIYHSTSIWNILATLVISALVCFGLAWYLTKPIHQLQKATRDFASGNLRARAKNFIGKRHDEFADLGEDFDRMADKIDQMIHSQKRLLSDVSHELRSPLTRMQIASGLALNKATDDNRKHLERIELEIERLDDMIGELLQVAALERGHYYEEKSSFVLNNLIYVLVQDAQFEANANAKGVIFNANEDIEFYGYYGLIARAVENILRNAIRHTEKNTQVTVNLSQNGNAIDITIQDQGPGVNGLHIDKIFEPFYRPTEARERTSGGTGLGLAIAKRGIEANGGKILAINGTECGLDKGLKVTIVLPKSN
ncbi:ATP-binding protein [Kangiella sp. TOML190]|uniref:ATP-binding protein n=1 Tax=Kangiella sp. TOML190 TaxID=2931351 RepID=UPI002042628E|nr:ATP-binding protein [Kangiella sp. TOML190]